MEALLASFYELILSVFNKEGIFIFVVNAVLLFVLAAFVFKWASQSGELKDLESAKYEMLGE